MTEQQRDFIGYGANPAGHPMAGRRPHSRLGGGELRGRQRGVAAGRRRVPRDQQRGAFAGAGRAARPVQRVVLRIRQPGWRVAHTEPAGQIQREEHVFLLRRGFRAESGSRTGRRRARPRSVRPRLPLGGISQQDTGRGSRRHPNDRRVLGADHRGASRPAGSPATAPA